MSNERELRNVIDIIHAYSFFLPNSYFDWLDWITLNQGLVLSFLIIIITLLERNIPVIIPMFSLLRI